MILTDGHLLMTCILVYSGRYFTRGGHESTGQYVSHNPIQSRCLSWPPGLQPSQSPFPVTPQQHDSSFHPPAWSQAPKPSELPTFPKIPKEPKVMPFSSQWEYPLIFICKAAQCLLVSTSPRGLGSGPHLCFFKKLMKGLCFPKGEIILFLEQETHTADSFWKINFVLFLLELHTDREIDGNIWIEEV